MVGRGEIGDGPLDSVQGKAARRRVTDGGVLDGRSALFDGEPDAGQRVRSPDPRAGFAWRIIRLAEREAALVRADPVSEHQETAESVLEGRDRGYPRTTSLERSCEGRAGGSDDIANIVERPTTMSRLPEPPERRFSGDSHVAIRYPKLAVVVRDDGDEERQEIFVFHPVSHIGGR